MSLALQAEALRQLALSNRSEAFLRLGRPQEAIEDALLALAIDPGHEKSASRLKRATALVDADP